MFSSFSMFSSYKLKFSFQKIENFIVLYRKQKPQENLHWDTNFKLIKNFFFVFNFITNCMRMTNQQPVPVIATWILLLLLCVKQFYVCINFSVDLRLWCRQFEKCTCCIKSAFRGQNCFACPSVGARWKWNGRKMTKCAQVISHDKFLIFHKFV